MWIPSAWQISHFALFPRPRFQNFFIPAAEGLFGTQKVGVSYQLIDGLPKRDQSPTSKSINARRHSRSRLMASDCSISPDKILFLSLSIPSYLEDLRNAGRFPIRRVVIVPVILKGLSQLRCTVEARYPHSALNSFTNPHRVTPSRCS